MDFALLGIVAFTHAGRSSSDAFHMDCLSTEDFNEKFKFDIKSFISIGDF